MDEVLALAMSFDGRYLASGGRDRRILVWDVKQDKFVKAFEGHKDAITVRYSRDLCKAICAWYLQSSRLTSGLRPSRSGKAPYSSTPLLSTEP